MQTWAWLAIAGVCFVIEVLTLILVFASLALGALVAALSQYLSGNLVLSWVVFAAVSVLSLTLLKPIALKYIFKKTPPSDTGIRALVGLKALATSEITESSGSISLKNEIWSARSTSGDIARGMSVTVESIDGAIAIVTKA
jgi:membrane protein implicated in regulation of membrane protease activity